MATVSRDLLMVFLLPSLIAGLILVKPDFSTIVNMALKSILLLAAAVFVVHMLGRLKRLLTSIHSSETIMSTTDLRVDKEEVQRIRQEAQALYDEQAAIYQKNVIRPKEEERQKKREEELNRLLKLQWGSSGYTLGGISREVSESLLRRRSLEHENDGPDHHQEQKVETDTNAIATLQVKKLEPLQNLPSEPETNVPNSVNIAMKSPTGTTHKRRFLITDKVEVLHRYMATIGYHQKHYGLYFSYPRQTISENPNASLEELGIIRDSLLNIEEKD